MKRIASFEIDHNILDRGFYVSRVDGDIVTYDLRMKKPNGNDYLTNSVMHTIEHIFATFVRNSKHSENVIYFGPMGCRTGFYLLMRNSVSKEDVLEMVIKATKFISDFEGEIPGSRKEECGNYLEHNLSGAKQEAKKMLSVLENYTIKNMQYK